VPTVQDLEKAHQYYYNEVSTEDVFYRVATELVNLTMHKKTKDVNLADAIAILLETWNQAYFRFNPSASKRILPSIKELLKKHNQLISDLRQRSIESYCEDDIEMVKTLFQEFQEPFGKTGAAKCLHLLAPRFFPLWDAKIAAAYKKSYKIKKCGDGDLYCHFMKITKRQVMILDEEYRIRRNPLKALDEYNFVTITRRKEL